MKCLKRLTLAGFPISITKCKFLEVQIDYLGMVLTDGKYGLGPKSLRNMLIGKLLTSIREVKGLLGRLNYASLFVPNYSKIVQPIVRLLGAKGDGMWTEEHTSCLNQIVTIVQQKIQLGHFDLLAPTYLHVD